MKKVKNISKSANYKDWYQSYGEEIAKMYPDYEITVDGGSYRGYDMSYKLDLVKKTLELDFYLPFYIDFKDCKHFLINDLKELYGINPVKV